jgi:hypothetical protein
MNLSPALVHAANDSLRWPDGVFFWILCVKHGATELLLPALRRPDDRPADLRSWAIHPRTASAGSSTMSTDLHQRPNQASALHLPGPMRGGLAFAPHEGLAVRHATGATQRSGFDPLCLIDASGRILGRIASTSSIHASRIPIAS